MTAIGVLVRHSDHSTHHYYKLKSAGAVCGVEVEWMLLIGRLLILNAAIQGSIPNPGTFAACPPPFSLSAHFLSNLLQIKATSARKTFRKKKKLINYCIKAQI